MSIRDYGLKIALKKCYSTQTFYEKLLNKGYNSEESMELVEDFLERGYLDDKDFTRRFIIDAVKIKKHGKRRIIYDLKRYGIDNEIIDEFINDFEFNEENILIDLISKQKFDLSDIKSRERIIRKFEYRGYSRADILNCMRALQEGGY